MAARARLDAELVRRGIARSREHAATLIADGLVTVRGMVSVKAATAVEATTPIHVRDCDDPGWASRGAQKLLGALETFEPLGLTTSGVRCLDAGASTGGFTDVLLRRGAREVVAVDVGRGLLDWRLRTDERVTVLDRTNARSLTPELLGGQVELIVADLSFISLRLVLPAFARCAAAGADVLPMVKPQFEVGRARLGQGGVVRDPELRERAILDVVGSAREHGFALHGVVASPLPGPSGNVEYFAWLRHAVPGDTLDGDPDAVTELIRAAVREGPR
ncbi:TlyA family RNA methyltransferase [Haloechinothrix sp. LS1_15]|uniref:TlyA family RNA methyltransferase n=1 Tax=Haloechinothrix sp. LS1_15 TaxID=2652248 RepID=UPI002947F26E|nr:TlyA family RNA methyltransferase [Haloechinothrix sp. LS1_15]MDV6013438.1 TlyA family RNA methyltransferase [Haloechinothrix sp. LS1_15]